MKKLTFSFSIVLILITTFLFRCNKEKDIVIQEQEVFFAIGAPDTKNGLEAKGSSDYNLTDARKIVLTIQNAEGTPTKYTSSELKIYQMNGAFFSQKLILKTGSYRLIEFLIMDSTENVIFAAPLTGSYEAQNVTYPLPIAFEVIKDISSRVNVEVISTENKSPEDFGLVSFGITEVKTIDFLITVVDKTNDSLLSARLTVKSGDYSYVRLLESVLNNKVSVKDSLGMDLYELTIQKSGYQTSHHTYTKDSLKLFGDGGDNGPLVVKLEKIQTGIITDIDGNTYRTVKIGEQWWMAENLRTTKFNDGIPLSFVTDTSAWSSSTIITYDPHGNSVYEGTSAYCWYNNDPAYDYPYGKLYNYQAVSTGKLCPAGWHVPSISEWEILKWPYFDCGSPDNYEILGADLMETGTYHWNNPYIIGTNETGFTALPGGYRNPLGSFTGITVTGQYWTSSLYGSLTNPIFYPIPIGCNYGDTPVRQIRNINSGFSVRCVKD
jgi:uncharacterized protein (TIGR02145 family)